MSGPEPRRPHRCAYVVSRYPYLSHTFIRNEIAALRERGVEVETVTVKRAGGEELIGAADREEARRTFAIRPVGPLALLADHRRALGRGARGYLAAMRAALRDSAGGPRSLLWQLFYFVQAVRLWAHLDRLELDHVHAHHANVAADLAMIAADLATRLGGELRWSLTIHGPTDLEQPEAHNLAAKVRRAAAVIAISEYARSRLRSLADSPGAEPRLMVIHCGIDPDVFDLPRRERGDQGLRVLTVARLEARKGLHHLIQALAAVRERGLPATLTVVGDGPERAALEARRTALGLEAAVEFAGAIGPDRIAGRYREADVFCLPSEAEGVPIVLMEAMAARLPVLATRIAGVPELIEDGQSGLLVAPGDPVALAAALQRIGSEPALAARLGEAGRQAVVDGFTISESAQRIAALFAGLSLADVGAEAMRTGA